MQQGDKVHFPQELIFQTHFLLVFLPSISLPASSYFPTHFFILNSAINQVINSRKKRIFFFPDLHPSLMSLPIFSYLSHQKKKWPNSKIYSGGEELLHSFSKKRKKETLLPGDSKCIENARLSHSANWNETVNSA